MLAWVWSRQQLPHRRALPSNFLPVQLRGFSTLGPSAACSVHLVLSLQKAGRTIIAGACPCRTTCVSFEGATEGRVCRQAWQGRQGGPGRQMRYGSRDSCSGPATNFLSASSISVPRQCQAATRQTNLLHDFNTATFDRSQLTRSSIHYRFSNP